MNYRDPVSTQKTNKVINKLISSKIDLEKFPQNSRRKE